MADNNNSDENKTETDEKSSESPPNGNARTAQTPIIESPTHSSKTKSKTLINLLSKSIAYLLCKCKLFMKNSIQG